MEMSLNSASIKTQKSPCEHFPNTRRYTFFISYTPHAFDYWDFETSVTWPPEIDCHQNVPIYNILQFHTTLQIRIQENMMNWWTFCYVYIVHHLNFMNVLMFSGVDVEPNLSLSSLSQDHLFSISSSCFQFGRRKIKIIVFSSSVKVKYRFAHHIFLLVLFMRRFFLSPTMWSSLSNAQRFHHGHSQKGSLRFRCRNLNIFIISI